jgi:DNA-binding MarR family transcriptional regulator
VPSPTDALLSAPLSAPPTDVTELAVELLVTSARFTRLATRESQSTIPHALWRALSQIEELGPLRISELAQADRCSQPTATTMVQRLEQRGWVTRATDPDDSRAVRIAVTPAGRDELAANRRTAGEHLAARMTRLDERDRVALAEGVRALHHLIDEQFDDPHDQKLEEKK